MAHETIHNQSLSHENVSVRHAEETTLCDNDATHTTKTAKSLHISSSQNNLGNLKRTSLPRMSTSAVGSSRTLPNFSDHPTNLPRTSNSTHLTTTTNNVKHKTSRSVSRTRSSSRIESPQIYSSILPSEKMSYSSNSTNIDSQSITNSSCTTRKTPNLYRAESPFTTNESNSDETLTER